MKTASRTKFFIEFYSTCLEGQRRPRAGVGRGGWGVPAAQGGWGPKLLRAVSPLVRGKGSWEVAFSWVSPTPLPRVQEEL